MPPCLFWFDLWVWFGGVCLFVVLYIVLCLDHFERTNPLFACACVCCVCWWFVWQVGKGAWWMPWHREPMKDVGACDMPWGVGNRALIRGCPNGETQLELCPVTCT